MASKKASDPVQARVLACLQSSERPIHYLRTIHALLPDVAADELQLALQRLVAQGHVQAITEQRFTLKRARPHDW